MENNTSAKTLFLRVPEGMYTGSSEQREVLTIWLVLLLLNVNRNIDNNGLIWPLSAKSQSLGMLSERKTGICGKSSQAADPLPPPSQFGKALFCKKNNLISKHQVVGLGQTPPPFWELFPHNPVFLSESIP